MNGENQDEIEQQWCVKQFATHYGKAEVRFLRGRLKFGGSKNSAPFPSMIVVFHGELRNRRATNDH